MLLENPTRPEVTRNLHAEIMEIDSRLNDDLASMLPDVRGRMERFNVSLRAMAEEAGVDRRVISIFMRQESGIDEDISLLHASEKEDLIKRLTEWMRGVDEADDLITQAEQKMAGTHTVSSLAKLLQIEAFDLSLVLTRCSDDARNGWRPKKAKIVRAIAEWLEIEDGIDGSLNFAHTPTFMTLQSYYGLAIATKSIVSIIGEVGIGKSHAAVHYWRMNPKTWRSSGVVYVRFKKGDTTEAAILGRIVAALYEQGLIATTSGDPGKIIRDTLGREDLLLLDEVHFTTDKGSRAIEVFHSLYDDLLMPMVLQGNSDLKGTLWDEKKQTFAGLANRAYQMPAMQTTKEDVNAWMDWAGYDNETMKRAARNIAARPGYSGELRTLVMIISAFEKMNPGQKLTAKGLKDAALMMGKA